MSLTIVKSVAGSGKTQYIIDKIADTFKPILIVTYTNENKDQIISRIIKKYKYLPPNIDILTWFDFLSKNLAIPYCNLFKPGLTIEGFDFDTDPPIKKSIDDPYRYINSKNQIYKDRLSDLCYIISDKSTLPINRLSKLYKHIFIDEAQDLCGRDYDIVEKLIGSKFEITIVGDSLQNTYDTHHTRTNSAYSDIFNFLESRKIFCINRKLELSYRCSQEVCNYINKIWGCEILKSKGTHSGGRVTLVYRDNLNKFIANNNNLTALRMNKKHSVNTNINPIFNIGKSKGLEFENIIIYGTKDMISATKNKDVNQISKQQTKHLFYVALTRSKNNVGIFVDEATPAVPLF